MLTPPVRRFLPVGALALASVVALAACGGGSTPGRSSDGTPAGTSTGSSSGETPAASPVDPATAGRLSGTIHFDGKAPAPQAIRMSSDPNCERANAATDASAGRAAVVDSVLVGDGGGLQNVFVYVKDGLPTGGAALRFPTPATPVVLDQRGCRYTPHVFGIQVGQPLQVVNSDMTLHNVHALPRANGEFNTGQPNQGMRMTHTFTAVEVMVPFRCDVHKWMTAWVGVLDHPFYTVSAADGSFRIEGLPPGTYTIEAWHETFGTQSQMVTIAAKGDASLSFTFKG